jgi:DNA invertase Pin-like site-specific DNA recombinase
MTSDFALKDRERDKWLDYLEGLALQVTRLQERHEQEKKDLDREFYLNVVEAHDKGVSLSDIARRLGLTRQSTHRYYRRGKAMEKEEMNE